MSRGRSAPGACSRKATSGFACRRGQNAPGFETDRGSSASLNLADARLGKPASDRELTLRQASGEASLSKGHAETDRENRRSSTTRVSRRTRPMAPLRVVHIDVSITRPALLPVSSGQPLGIGPPKDLPRSESVSGEPAASARWRKSAPRTVGLDIRRQRSDRAAGSPRARPHQGGPGLPRRRMRRGAGPRPPEGRTAAPGRRGPARRRRDAALARGHPRGARRNAWLPGRRSGSAPDLGPGPSSTPAPDPDPGNEPRARTGRGSGRPPSRRPGCGTRPTRRAWPRRSG